MWSIAVAAEGERKEAGTERKQWGAQRKWQQQQQLLQLRQHRRGGPGGQAHSGKPRKLSRTRLMAGSGHLCWHTRLMIPWQASAGSGREEEQELAQEQQEAGSGANS
jgi:hypothetical protein